MTRLNIWPFLIIFLITGCAPGAKLTQLKGNIPNLYQMHRSTPFPKAELKILSPHNGQVLSSGQVEVRFEVKGYSLKKITSGSGKNGLAYSKKGQHIHLIVDNQPYQAIYDISQPIRIKGLTPGFHSIQAFLSRSWHEAVKENKTLQTVSIFVDQKAKAPSLGNLIYSRPKGIYQGEGAKQIMVDFYIPDYESYREQAHQVQLIVDGQSVFLKDWTPYVLKDLSEGEHQIVLRLVDQKGEGVPGAYNSTTRSIQVQ